MATKLYVGNLSYQTTEQDLNRLFSESGTVVSAQVITDRDTGQPRGFAFVEMSSEDEAKQAIAANNGKTVDGRALAVNEFPSPRRRRRRQPWRRRRHGRWRRRRLRWWRRLRRRWRRRRPWRWRRQPLLNLNTGEGAGETRPPFLLTPARRAAIMMVCA